MSRKSSQKRIEANRRNALKSTGPRTPEGKAASAANSLRHGLSSVSAPPLAPGSFLHMESQAAFTELLNEYLATYQPRHRDEVDLLTEAVFAKWRQQRLWVAEASQIEIAIAENEASLQLALPRARSGAHLANGVAKSENQLKLYLRYDAQLRRHYRQCLQDLQALQSQRRPLDDSPNEPNTPTRPDAQPDSSPQPEPEPAPQPPSTPGSRAPNEANFTPEPAHVASRNAEVQRFAEPSRALRVRRDGEIA